MNISFSALLNLANPRSNRVAVRVAIAALGDKYHDKDAQITSAHLDAIFSQLATANSENTIEKHAEFRQVLPGWSVDENHAREAAEIANAWFILRNVSLAISPGHTICEVNG